MNRIGQRWSLDMSYYGYGADYGSGHTYHGPGAVSQLTGPGSSAYVRTAYHNSYAYETERGGIYTSDSTYYTNGFVNHTHYAYNGADVSYKSSSTYTDYDSHTQQSPYSRAASYYSSDPSPYGSTTTDEQSSSGTYHYSGHNEYLSTTSLNTSQTSEGYIYSTDIQSTFERTDGSFDEGSGTQSYTKSFDSPYGYVSSESHTSQF